MTAKGSCCCCSKCGVALPADVAVCCLCVCDKLCVSVTSLGPTGSDPGECNCPEVRKTEVPWDPDECAYIGTVNCGTVSIDVRFDIKLCNGECHLCLTSSCLGLSGVCGASDCQPFNPGNISGDCGDYLRDCSQLGGWNESWNIDASNCHGVETTCDSMLLEATCYPRINPAGHGITRLCKDCDCVCECISITYEETFCDSQEVISCWNEDTGTRPSGWFASFECPDGDGQQTITISLQRDEESGCCYWLVAITSGYINQGAVTGGSPIMVSSQLFKTSCPEFGLSFEVDLVSGDSGVFDISCAPCDRSVPLCDFPVDCYITPSHVDMLIGGDNAPLLVNPGKCLTTDAVVAVEWILPSAITLDGDYSMLTAATETTVGIISGHPAGDYVITAIFTFPNGETCEASVTVTLSNI